jgi:hypothetical protein
LVRSLSSVWFYVWPENFRSMRAGLFLIASEPVLLKLDIQTSRPPPSSSYGVVRRRRKHPAAGSSRAALLLPCSSGDGALPLPCISAGGALPRPYNPSRRCAAATERCPASASPATRAGGTLPHTCITSRQPSTDRFPACLHPHPGRGPQRLPWPCACLAAVLPPASPLQACSPPILDY